MSAVAFVGREAADVREVRLSTEADLRSADPSGRILGALFADLVCLGSFELPQEKRSQWGKEVSAPGHKTNSVLSTRIEGKTR